ncbi:carboxylating nicotinate-nucleotide diphosphorylase [Arhodomonas aquaeolei]|uniref:carboxylating nicotinate-nucleotide diphosphorylase n=2 Tax=Arhodomonas TaxID=2368 RepID=UPI0021677B3B|nr:carboxylating nicotinate-nucleotide diphosphorylase [Arhodomonas aquaeolei]MCS4505736.1 carboxylating nicotinate-nucleotide diphosphorylase [Arhodomonas aquaeolei]
MIDPQRVADDARRALDEDVGSGDITAVLLPAGRIDTATVIVREPAVICGRPWFDAVYQALDPAVHIRWHVNDGDAVDADTLLCTLTGPARSLVTGERTALNFLQLLSGTATTARRYADALAGTGCRVLDTRKTLPGLRRAQKYATACGGAVNHRQGLFDAILIKENHVLACGGITAAVQAARHHHPDVTVEVETETLDEVAEALAAGADIIMLDNFPLAAMREAVAMNAGRARLEASGNVEWEGLAGIAATGVDYVSTGALTKHVRAVDLSMRLQPGTPQR